MKIKANLTPELVEIVNELACEDRAECCILSLGEIKDFFIYNWGDMPTGKDAVIKSFLIELCSMQKMFENFIQKEGGVA